jgi:hypothetical protein
VWAGIGLTITLFFPTRLVAQVMLPGSSLLILPLVVGWMTS